MGQPHPSLDDLKAEVVQCALDWVTAIDGEERAYKRYRAERGREAAKALDFTVEVWRKAQSRLEDTARKLREAMTEAADGRVS